jgi:TatD DNase family protein
MLIDTHAHLDLDDFDADQEAVIERARANGVEKIITIGIGLKECRRALEIAAAHPFIYAAIGIHPHNASGLDLEALDFLEMRARDTRVVALGEIGLDFYRNRSPQEDQVRAFRAQLDLAEGLKLPVVIHDRDAHAETLQILREERPACGGVLHCFSGDTAMARDCIDLGFLISIPGTVTFKNATTLHAVARDVGLEHLLLETDCPFLTPMPHRGKRNEPAYVRFVAEKVAELKNISVAEVISRTGENACRLFNLIP